MGSILNIEAVIGDAAELELSAAEIEDVLAVAYLAMRADGRLSEEEIDSFERAVAAYYGEEAKPHQATTLMDRFAQQAANQGLSPMLAQVAGRLSRVDARHEAYKLAYGMSLGDLDTNDNEYLFEDELREALGIPEEVAESLIDEVIDAVGADEEDDEED